MDLDTAQAIQSLVNMVDHVHSTKSFQGFTGNLAIAAICALRSNGSLSPQIEAFVDQTFVNFQEIIDNEPYENTQSLFLSAREMWDASAPR